MQTLLTNRNKPKLPKNSCPGCYRVPCKCGGNYIGQTKKQKVSRFNEHEKAIFQGNTADSALSEHSINCTHDIDWENASTISNDTNYQQRCVREALEIQKENIGPNKEKLINREAGLYVTSSAWLTLLNKLNATEKSTSNVK